MYICLITCYFTTISITLSTRLHLNRVKWARDLRYDLDEIMGVHVGEHTLTGAVDMLNDHTVNGDCDSVRSDAIKEA